MMDLIVSAGAGVAALAMLLLVVSTLIFSIGNR
jgi:hypothetical protein